MKMSDADLILSPDWLQVPPDDSHPGYAIYTNEIKKSPKDPNLYNLIRLGNAIEVLLVSDSCMPQAAAALAVGVAEASEELLRKGERGRVVVGHGVQMRV